MCAKGIPRSGVLRGLQLAAAAACLSVQACRAADPGPVIEARLTSGPVAAAATAVACAPAPPASPALTLVYAEPSTRTLVTAVVTLAADGTTATEATVLDRIAEGADTSPDFGSHAYARIGATEYLAYLDRAADGQLALKLLKRTSGRQTWEIDILEPTGKPLCLLSHGSTVHLLVLDGTVLRDHSLTSPEPTPAVLAPDCRPLHQISVARSPAGDSFAFLDAARDTVLTGMLVGGSVSLAEVKAPRGVRFGGPCHLRADRDGLLCLFFYDAAAQDLMDLRDLRGENRVIGVTRARGVTALYASSEADETVYVYAESTMTAGGRPTHALSMLESRAGGGRSATSYRRIHISPVPYATVQPSAGDGELRIVTLTDALQLFRVPLRP